MKCRIIHPPSQNSVSTEVALEWVLTKPVGVDLLKEADLLKLFTCSFQKSCSKGLVTYSASITFRRDWCIPSDTSMVSFDRWGL